MYIKRTFIKIFSVIMLAASVASQAATIVPKTNISDANNDHKGGYEFDIQSMDVEILADGTMRVDIFTNFGNWNNRLSSGQNGIGNIVFGDLLLGSTGEAGNYDYAFKLTDEARYKDYMDPVVGVKTVSNGGNLYAINGTESAKNYHGANANVQSGYSPVFGTTTGPKLGATGTVEVGTQYASGNGANVGFDTVSFIFNVGNIFANSSQLSLSWAMSCYNDAVHGVVNLQNTPPGGGGGGGGVKSVPEPSSIIIMLLGLFIMSRQYRAKM